MEHAKTEPIFLEPVLQERIWGGQRLAAYGYDLPYERTGECWGISAHPHGQSKVARGPLKGKTLPELWDQHGDLFGGKTSETFPLLVKLLDAREDLSVQVHPNDEQAKRLEDHEAYGKTECWYVVEAEQGAELILGHTAKSKAEFVEMVEAGRWDELLRRIPIQTGDFFHVPSGTIHALGAGSVILETQQSSDTTYRVYDFDRIGADGKKRELHLDKAQEVAMIPHAPYQANTETLEKSISHTLTRLVATEFFTVYKAVVQEKWEAAFQAPYVLVSVISGEGELVVNGKKYALGKGDHFILPVQATSFEINGHIEAILSHT